MHGKKLTYWSGGCDHMEAYVVKRIIEKMPLVDVFAFGNKTKEGGVRVCRAE